MSRKLMNLALMYTAITAYASEYPFGPPSHRLGTPNGNIPSDKQKCQPKAQHEFTSKWWKWLKRASYSLFHYNKNVEQQKLIKRSINEMSSVLLDNLYGYWRGDLSDYLKDRGNLEYFMRGYKDNAYSSVMEWLDKK